MIVPDADIKRMNRCAELSLRLFSRVPFCRVLGSTPRRHLLHQLQPQGPKPGTLVKRSRQAAAIRSARAHGTPIRTLIMDITAPTTCHITDITDRGAGLT
jgi:hypothetical protein